MKSDEITEIAANVRTDLNIDTTTIDTLHTKKSKWKENISQKQNKFLWWFYTMSFIYAIQSAPLKFKNLSNKLQMHWWIIGVG